ncbi:MAG: hypothetical protein EA351_13465 [Gemmatimonadales bacterium]|nr:MAG: hypothetical protein EA351_13465 [Gemmatimonadales bacterium]
MLWAYGYKLVPPIARDRMGPIKALLEGAYQQAGLGAFAWEGRLINGDDITHILVVSDRPEQDLEVNHLLEAELNRLQAPFTITRALAIGGDSGSGRLPEPLGNA